MLRLLLGRLLLSLLPRVRLKLKLDILGISLTVYNAKENGKVRFNQDDMRTIKNVLSEKLNKKLTIDELFF